ncbi:hypothetical protein FUAX_08470 [Fulvitalea axinellae]|uniref:Uncharacterized protein n=1 Tax=Fulvitalea axinellae TaxID=1182444 RepID=A0AAU9D856_9BACT|nr:hypothetical protein FUAX_08470 [Fulvitalea axinellae]
MSVTGMIKVTQNASVCFYLQYEDQDKSLVANIKDQN